MKPIRQDITVRSVLVETKDRLCLLQQHTRLTYGSLIDDAVEALWDAYEAEGHEITMAPSC